MPRSLPPLPLKPNKMGKVKKFKIGKRVKLFDLKDGAQVVVNKDTDTDHDCIVKMKIYTEIKDEVYISFEVPLHCENKEKQSILFDNDEKLKDFAVGVYNSQMKLIVEDFKPL